MAKVLKYAIGLDIAKEKFDACLAVIDDMQNVVVKSSKSGITNTGKGFSELLSWSKNILPPALHCFLHGSHGYLL
jgi:hypothetical protein